jgi:competence ComEA-like helix-hairpin-helix protein
MKKMMADYFSFSKKERIAVVILLVVIAGFIALPYFFGVKKKPAKPDAQLQQQIASLQSDKKADAVSTSTAVNFDGQKQNYSSSNAAATKFETFQFDPNTLDESGWIRLGLRDKTAKTILNYRSKGGKFKTPEDLRKIWGLRKDEADRIIPHAVIAAQQTYKPNTPNNNYTNRIPAKTTATSIDINAATPQDFYKLPGMDKSLPYRIINFRNKLGGFISAQQVRETWGMTDSVFTSIKPYLQLKTTDVKKININIATELELNAHPYIDKYAAKAIANYRTQHGNFQTIHDIKKIPSITEQIFNKISPYLSVQ